MTGGRQLESRRNKLREMLGEKVTLGITNNFWHSSVDPIAVEGILEFRNPDKGYFLKNTNVQIIVPYVDVVNRTHEFISMNLTWSPFHNQSPNAYLRYKEEKF